MVEKPRRGGALLLPLSTLLCALACGESPQPGDPGPTAEATAPPPKVVEPPPPPPRRADRTLREAPRLIEWMEAGIGRRVADMEVTTAGKEVLRLADLLGEEALVVAFRDFECPVSKRLGGELRRVEAEYAERGVAFLFVYPGGFDSAELVEKDIEAFGYEGTYVVDHDDSIALALRAETTTETFVLDPGMTMVYRGALSDRVGRGFHHEKARIEYLRDALDQVLADREVATKATTAPGCFLGLEFPEESLEFNPGEVTWHDQISRIVQQRCTTCHFEGGIGPFRLREMEDLTKRDGMIEFVVEEGVMPPWLTTAETGPWRNDLQLSDWQRAALLAWIEDDCPEGDPALAPSRIEYASEWTIGEPDIVLEAVQEQVIPAEGEGDYRWMAMSGVIEEDLWVTGIEVRSSAPEVVHHTIVEIIWPEGAEAPYEEAPLDRNMVPRRYKEAHEEKLREAGLDVDSNASRFFFLSAPGNPNMIYPPDVATFVPKGAQFVLQVHYTPSGVETTDVSSIGMVTMDEEPDYVAVSRKLARIDIDLPPNTADIRYEFEFEAQTDLVLYSMAPHMHLRGRWCTIDVVHPDGTEERLLDIPEWDLDWNIRYAFLNGRRFQTGSKIKMIAMFDNTSANPENPDPNQRVRYGPLTEDEMLLVIVDTVYPRKDG